ncbi:DoxX family protein [Portibacter lacus]|uniref:Membrane protein n=1 Tax=Portibacter lacus TaxID=1099794 RepID=A0AA37WFD6_9BACT|nr:DoxX family protein [Portibacter lacus]GLR18748.1 membrane protein [Portibacter lacus]
MKENKTIKWVSIILQGIIAIMFLMSAGMNLSGSETAVAGAADMGYPASSVLYFGIVQLLMILLYIYPKTSIIGAILMTGWLGGAVATHIIHGDAVSMTIVPIIVGVVAWIAIGLRNEKLKSLFSF